MKNLVTIFKLLFCTTFCIAQTYPTMITVEGGTFTMGDTEIEGKDNEHPPHQVTLKTFKIAKTETTVAQWRAFCTATGRAMPQTPSWGWIDNHPIVRVDYYEAKAYCKWLAEKMGADYRLPTEAEWEFAARGGKLSKGTKYSGDSSLDNAGWYEANSNRQTQPVASKNPNELGIYDMSGNVWEWCIDWYSDYGGVYRGGSWGGSATYCNVAYRWITGRSINICGLRVVLSR